MSDIKKAIESMAKCFQALHFQHGRNASYAINEARKRALKKFDKVTTPLESGGWISIRHDHHLNTSPVEVRYQDGEVKQFKTGREVNWHNPLAVAYRLVADKCGCSQSGSIPGTVTLTICAKHLGERTDNSGLTRVPVFVSV